MPKFAASFLGRDCPGVVAAVAGLLTEARCDIVEVSQTILAGEFAAIFIVNAPETMDDAALNRRLQLGLAEREVDLSAIVRPAVEGCWGGALACEPFVVTADGPDRPGLIAGMSGVFARHGVNIENLKALLGHAGEGQALFVFEVMVPPAVEISRLRGELVSQGERLSLRVSVQHRDIFEAVHRVPPA